MSDFKQWAIAVCVICVITAVYKMLMPKGNIKKCADVTMSLVVLVVMLSPLFSGKTFFPELNGGIDIFSDYKNIEDNKGYKSVISQTVINVLDKNNILYNSVDVDMNIDDDGYIIIKCIEINLDNATQKDEVLELVKKETQFDEQVFKIR